MCLSVHSFQYQFVFVHLSINNPIVGKYKLFTTVLELLSDLFVVYYYFYTNFYFLLTVFSIVPVLLTFFICQLFSNNLPFRVKKGKRKLDGILHPIVQVVIQIVDK